MFLGIFIDSLFIVVRISMRDPSITSGRNIVDACLRCLWVRLAEAFPLICNMPGFNPTGKVRVSTGFRVGVRV